MHRLSRTGRARARRRADVRVGALRSVYSLYDKPPSQQAIQFLIKKPIMRVPATPGASPGSIMVYPVTRVPAGLKLPHGWILQRETQATTFEELAPSQTYVKSRLRSRLAHHPNSGLQGGVEREGGLGGP